MANNLVIIGGGAGGASTAAEAKRSNPSLNVIMLQKGGYVAFGSCPTPYFIGDRIKDVNKLVSRTPEEFRESGIDVRLNTEVVNVHSKENFVETKDGNKIPYDFLVFATGTNAFTAPIAGKDLPGVFSLRNLEDAVAIKTWLRNSNAKRVIIIGGGVIGMEMTDALHEMGIATTIINKDPLPANRWDAQLASLMLEELQSNHVEFISNAQAKSIEKGQTSLLKVTTDQGTWEGDMVLLAIGVRPNVELAQSAGLAIGKTGAIAVNFAQRASMENVYAAGDCCESWNRVSRRWVNVPLGDIANKQGRVAGRNIGGKPLIFNGIVRAQSFRIFNLECAAAGISEEEALDAGYAPVSHVTWGSAISPSLGKKKIGLMLTADKSSGKLLGAQAVGFAGAVGRINTLSIALWTGLTLDEIGYIDLAYAPTFGAVWDIIHTAAHALKRKIAN
ncbi:MAG TPA: FAD-dependent oxidoreductase [Smithella sp.]|nr:FAD-dependent oxidoreductase [Smithella sp.]